MLRALLLVAYRLLYNELAWTYDLVSWVVSLGQWRGWQRAALPYLRAGRVLEIAHGTGNLLLDLHAQGRAPIGFDLSPAMGAITRHKLRRHGLNLPLARGRVQALPFANNSFPNLLATFPAEFILDPVALAEFYRVLQPGGVFVIVPTAQFLPHSPPDRLTHWLFRPTGQVAGWPRIEQPYVAAGFTLRLERVRLPHSIALVLVAQK